MTVRAATVLDVQRIAEIHVAAWRAAYAGHMPAEFLANLSVERRRLMWTKMLAEPNPGMVSVSLDDTGQPAGFCLYGPSRDEDARGKNIGELQALNVLPSTWRNGHGGALCRAVLAHAQSVHWDVVTLWVLQGNERARLFYEAFGFEAEGSQRQDTSVAGCVLHDLRYRKVIGRVENRVRD
jgi:RimJ/RimL family protein N-acetyltransferase